ncbi:MAG: ATP-binding protein, partial [Candidatus Acidiferrales bacterium]
MPTPNADPANENKIKADPSKAFFIEMLIRDISLDECILDLTDNSVHNLIRESNLDVMQTLLGKSPAAKRLDANIAIATSAKEFRIEDTCGGITIDDAREDVFLFGKSKRETAHTGLGVYGIGMKRAFFKLGRNITVESRTDTEEFRVDIDVDEWESRPDDWSLSFAYARKRDKNGRQPGTTITVRDLNTSVKTYFDNISFQNELTRRLASTYALFLKAGLTLSINGNIVKPRLPELLTSGDLKPVRNLFRAG